jgi:SAM-dependent methyltransferase
LRFEILDWKHPRQMWALFAAPKFDSGWFKNKPLTWNAGLERALGKSKGETPGSGSACGLRRCFNTDRVTSVITTDCDREPSASLEVCPVCGHDRFTNQPILWPELIEQWELSPEEVSYIDLQQGFCCANCKNNLRAMTLAAAVTSVFGFAGSFQDFCRSHPGIRQLTVIEINQAKNLSPFLQALPKYALHSFPQLDMRRMSFADSSIDLIIHSDTLEHVPTSKVALEESRRVLKPGGHLFYTVPIVIGRLTRTRRGLPSSYHGRPGVKREDCIVQTEYGADFWCEIFEAGFREVRLTSLIFPASVAIHAVKT